jgi:hypothetical protein
MLVVSQTEKATGRPMTCMVFPASRDELEARVKAGLMYHCGCSYIVASRVLSSMGL